MKIEVEVPQVLEEFAREAEKRGYNVTYRLKDALIIGDKVFVEWAFAHKKINNTNITVEVHALDNGNVGSKIIINNDSEPLVWGKFSGREIIEKAEEEIKKIFEERETIRKIRSMRGWLESENAEVEGVKVNIKKEFSTHISEGVVKMATARITVEFTVTEPIQKQTIEIFERIREWAEKIEPKEAFRSEA